MISITSAAVSHLNALLHEKQAEAGTGLRLRVEKGGCAGFQYAMLLDKASTEDAIVAAENVTVIIDPESAGFLRGCTLDYVESLNDSGFKIENPNAARSCGCGTSFEPRQEA